MTKMPDRGNADDREVIDGVRVITRQVAQHAHLANGKMTTWQDIDEVLLEDGRTVYQCNSRYGNCPLFHENFSSVFAHLKYHVPTDRKTVDRPKNLPNPDRKIRTSLPDEPAVVVGEAAAVILGSGFTGTASLEPALGTPFARSNGDAVAETHQERYIPKTKSRSDASRQAWETRRRNEAIAVREQAILEPERRPFTPMIREGLLARIELMIDSVHDIARRADDVDNALHGLHQDVSRLGAGEVIDPEIAEKAAKFDQMRGLLG